MGIKKSVGEKIKEIRISRSISVSELSVRCNIETSQIELIEENKLFPSLAPLVKIARSLGVSLGTFLDDDEQIAPVVSLSGDTLKGASFSNMNQKAMSHMDFFALASNKAGRHMEPFIVDLNPGNANDYMLSSHEGEEFIYVLEGEIEINYGKETYRLNIGESIYYDSIVSHNVHTAGDKKSKIVAVIYIPF
jgi:transcriptional regulator with XRE-family HTH domain